MAEDINSEEHVVTKSITVSMGPQHPSGHGVLHLILDMQGEMVTSAVPDIGYLHRGTEKIAENLLYSQFVPYTDRLDYFCAMSNNLSYVLAVEKLLDIESPERAQYIRVICAELSRLAGHLGAIGAWAVDLGAMSMLLYAYREREMVLDLFEMLCGARMTHSYLRVGGVRYDMTKEFVARCREFLKILPVKIDEYERLLTGNRIWIKRNKDIGVISGAEAIDFGLTGPNLRGSGIDWDIRKDEPYLVYDRLDFDVPTGTTGDCFDRYMVRIGEMREAIKIIGQCLDALPAGEFNIDDPTIVPPKKYQVYKNMENLIHHFKYVSDGFKAPEGEVYAQVEAPKGELGVYLVGDGTEKPYRLKLRVPSFVNLHALNRLCVGYYFADVIAVLSSLDPVFGECDK
jgi:NADH-quinone oxidoreductase subunit D